MRFCSGCRKPQAETDFEPGRKMCNRHKNKKKKKKVDLDATGTSSNITNTTDPTTGLPNLSTVPQLLTSLRAASDLDGVHKYEAACRITDLPGQEHVELELKLPYTVVGESRPAPELNAAESMRRARARARPLIELIHQATGYSFVYKDCRTGPKLKYAHSLRYLCAQRSDQDDTKRRSAARRAEKKAAAEAAREAGGGKAGDDDEDEEGGSEEEEQEQEEQERELQRLVRAAQAQEDQEGEIYVDEVPVVATGTAGSELGVRKGRGKGKGKGKAQAKGKAKGKGKAGAPNGREEASPSPAAAATAQLEGSASASPVPVGPSSPSTSTTTAAAQKKQARATLKKMERFPCRGSLIINIHHDDVTCTFSINHFLHHAEYVDVVGNRLRGAKYHALPVNLNTTITAPVGSIELGTDLLEDGSTPTWLDRAEQTFVALSELVRELRGKRGGGEEEASRVLYERSEGCRSYRIAVLEALAKGGQGIPKPEAGSKPKTTPAAGGGRKKRKVDQVDGAVEEGPVVQGEGEGEEGGAAQGGGGGLDVQATAGMAMDLDLPIMDDLPDLPPLPGPSHSHSHELSMEEAMGLDVRSLLASASAAASVSGLRHQLGDAGNGEDLTVDYSALQHEWMDPRLS